VHAEFVAPDSFPDRPLFYKVFLAGSTSSMLITPMSLPMQGDGGRQWRVEVVSVVPVSFLYRETFHFQKALTGVMQHAAQA
jgi:hypothetical protein